MRDEVWKSAEVSRRYLDGVRGAIPFAEEQIDLLLRLSKKAFPTIHQFLDLGCGDGILGRALIGQNPEARGVFLDFSETMIAAAKAKKPTLPETTIFLVEDYGNPTWLDRVVPHGPFELIVSGFSIHHQPDARKRELFRELYGLLIPGGLFLNLEHVSSSSGWIESAFDEYFVEALCRFHARHGTGKTSAQITDEYYHRPDKAANILAPVPEQCQWLREIGFQDVDCFFKVFELALFGGRKRV